MHNITFCVSVPYLLTCKFTQLQNGGKKLQLVRTFSYKAEVSLTMLCIKVNLVAHLQCHVVVPHG